jgi:hypothetical protein
MMILLLSKFVCLFSFFCHIEVSQNTTPPIMLLVPLKKSINRDAPSFWTYGAKVVESYYWKFNEVKTKTNQGNLGAVLLILLESFQRVKDIKFWLFLYLYIQQQMKILFLVQIKIGK